MTAPPRFRHPAVALLAVALLHGTGCGPKEVTPAPAVPLPPSGKPKDDAGPPPAVAKTEAAPSLTADQLAQEIERNPRAALAKYGGTVLELSGVVDGVGQTLQRGPYLTLEVQGHDIGIMCYMADKEPWARVSPGSGVKVRGKWPRGQDDQGRELVVRDTLQDCVLVEVGHNPAPVLSAGQLAKEYAAGPEATNKKYNGKWLIVDGEVADKGKEVPAKIYLKGSGKVRVRCEVSPFEKQLTEPLQTGQHVKLLGQYARTAGNTDTEVGLYDCLPITPSK
jgi:tRNA_anti-like